MLTDVGRTLHPPWSMLVAPGLVPTPSSISRLRNSVVGIGNVVTIERSGALWFVVGSSTVSTLDGLRDRLRTRGVTVIVGRVGATAAELAVDAAKLHILSQRGVGHDGLLHDIAEYDVEVLLGSHTDIISADLARRRVGPLSDVLRETALAVLANDLSIVAAATALHTHRNTVVQRLARIQELTGLNLRHFGDAVTMRLALAANVHDVD